jgi:hypothetical protein
MTQFVDYVAAIAFDKDLGNALAHMATAFPGDPDADMHTFDDSRICTPSGWWALVPARTTFSDVVDAINEQADYNDPRVTYLHERDVSPEMWAAVVSGAIVRMVHFPRIVDGQLNVTMQPLFDLAADVGVTIVEPDDV